MSDTYISTDWADYPDDRSPIEAEALNNMESGISSAHEQIGALKTTKLDTSVANTMVKDVSCAEETGIFTVEYLNGTKVSIDTNLEKIAINFSYDEAEQQIVITLEDGTKQYIDLSSLITEYEFEDSETVTFTVEGGKVKAAIKKGAVTADMLEPDYLASVQSAATTAQTAAENALSSKTAAANSATAAGVSETNAASSATEAAASEASATLSKQTSENASQVATECKVAAEMSEANAAASETNAAASATAAAASRTAAESSETNAQASAVLSQENAQTATNKAILAESYAKGGTGTRQGEDTDNAYYYMQQAKAQSGGIPTKLSDLLNDCDFVNSMTQSLAYYYRSNQVYTKEEVDGKISSIPKFGIVVVEELPTQDISDTTIYLLKESEGGTNKCSEWVYADGAWEKLGDVDIDLSDYVSKSGLLTATGASEENTMTQKAITEALAGKQATIQQNTAFNKNFETNAGNIRMDGAASAGSSTNVARSDHVHPSDTSKLSTSGDASNVFVNFTPAATFANLTSGSSLAVIMGQLAQCIPSLNDRAGSYTGAITIEAGKTSKTIAVAGMTENSLVDVYYAESSKETVASAGVTYTLAAGSLTLTFGSALGAAVTISNIKVVNV